MFREAYSWRQKKPSSLRPDRMSFESFVADDPAQIVMGLFSDSLCAVYLFYQTNPTTFDCHFTSRRDAPKDAVLSAGHWLVQFFAQNNLHLRAFVTLRNKPLRAWVEAVGLKYLGIETFLLQSDTEGDNVPAMANPFAKYGV